MNIRKREIFRYLGYKYNNYDSETDIMIDELVNVFINNITPKSYYSEFTADVGNSIIIGGNDGFTVESNGLKKNLSGCKSVLLFAATLGTEADKLIKKYMVTSMARAAVSQAVCTEILESYCNEVVRKISDEKQKEGLYLRPRFSPGYGDFSLSYQTDFFRMLDITKQLQIYLNDELLMQPTKSITAIIGITGKKDSCNIKKCRLCSKKDCEFRDEF